MGYIPDIMDFAEKEPGLWKSAVSLIVKQLVNQSPHLNTRLLNTRILSQIPFETTIISYKKAKKMLVNSLSTK